MLGYTALHRTTLLLLPLLVAGLWAAPLTKYDQRQEGELNVHAHLENFVILLIPGGSGLFNFAAKIASGKHHGSKHVKGHAEGGSKNALEDQSVTVPLGIKSPPYKVDIDADRRTPIVLEITAPRFGEEQHEVVIAESPAVTFTKTQPAEKEKPSPDSEKSEPEKPEAENSSSQMDPSEKPNDPEEKPSEVAEKPKESSEKQEEVPSPAKSEVAPPSKPAEKPLKKPVEAVAAVAAPAADQKEVAVSGDAERPAVPAKPATAPAAADAPATPAGEPAQAPPTKQVAQEAKSRASRLELLGTGLAPSPVQVPCSAHEVRDGRCGRAMEPARITVNYEDAAFLKALKYGLSPAN